MNTAPAPDALLVARGLALRAGDRRLVEGLDLSLAPGDRLVIVGGNGSGKSTLLHVLAGLRSPDGGEVQRPHDPPGMVFQDGAFWPHMTVDQHLAFVDRAGDPAWRRRLLEAFRIAGLASRKPEALSGGERLRLGLARSLAGRPRWLLLDEPLAHLDVELSTAVRQVLPELADELGAAMITVTHDPDDVLLFGDTVLALTGCGPWWLGPAQEALERPPTATLAAFSERGTVLAARADADGRADFGLGLGLDDLDPGAEVQAFLERSAVSLVDAPGVTAVFQSPDRRGGCWVKADGHLLRCDGRGDGHRRGDRVALRIDGAPRLLLDTQVTT